jgi:hypothetical protein
MTILKTGACFTTELALNCPTIVACVTALPVGAAGVAGTTQVLGKDGQYHTLPAATSAADGSETKVTAGINTTVTGAGTVASPYVVSSTATAAAQTLSLAGQTLSLSGGGGSVTIPDLDTQDLSIIGNVISLTNGGSVTLPTATAPTLSIAGSNLSISGGNTVALPAAAAVAFATPAETVAGTSTTLAVNPADLYARENIAAQTGLGLVLSAIPAPTASQSNWGVNTLGETLHYAPGIGWEIVAKLHGASQALSVNLTPANSVITDILSFTMPRAGDVTFTVSQQGLGNFYLNANYILKNGILFRRIGSTGSNADPSNWVDAGDISGAATNVSVVAGDVFTLAGQIRYNGGGSGFWSTSLSDFSYQYNA